MANQGTAGIGSIWNNNNWFYEEKNYTKFAKEYLNEQIPKLQLAKNDTLVKLYEIKTIEGEASVTIRKQKQIFLYEFELEIYFEAMKTENPSQKCKGKIKVHEFNQDDDELTIDITQDSPATFVDEVKKILKGEMNDLLLKTVMGLGEAMRERDVDEVKILKDKMEREQAKKNFEEAKATTDDVKQEIFDKAKEQEAQMKLDQAQLAKQGVVPLKSAPVNKVEGTGSVWNNNSYHWEQKSVEKWAEDTLKTILGTFYFKYEKATLKITEVKELKGESSVSIRKSKKIVTYDYNVKLLWKVDMGDETNTKVIGSIEGEYEILEMSNDVIDDGEQWEINCRITGGDETLKQTLFQVVKKYAPDELRKHIITNFVDELKKK